jgi:hypothetical protein
VRVDLEHAVGPRALPIDATVRDDARQSIASGERASSERHVAAAATEVDRGFDRDVDGE